jgi:PAS domain S-box-containing protein
MPAPAPPSDLGALIARLQSHFLRSARPHEVFDALLPELLEVTGSAYGFIGEVWRDAADAPYLKIFSLSDIGWDAATRARVARERQHGLEFRRLDTLFGLPLQTRQTLVANDAANDPRRGGLPPGHPPLHSFLGVPLFHGGELVGEVALANRAGGYDEALLAQFEPLFVALGAIVGSVLLERQRQHAEQQLRRSEAHHRRALDLAGIGMAHMGLDGRFLEVNDALCRFLDRPREQLLGLRIDDVAQPGESPALPPAGGDSQPSHEQRYRLPDGRVRWAITSAALVRTEDAQPEHLITFIQDIDERKRAEAELRERDALLHKLTQHLPAVVFQYHRSAAGWEAMPFATEGLRQAYGLAPSQVRDNARGMWERVHADDRPRLATSVAESAAKLKPWRLEYRVHAPDGSLRWHEGHASPEPDAAGGTLWHGYIVDISERKRYEQAVVTAEAAQRANAAKTQFLSRMSHELRTPLNAVIGFAQLLQIDPAHPLRELQRTRLEHIERAGAHLLAMINDVLDLSRIESGDMPLALEPLALDGLFDDALAMLAGPAHTAGVTLRGVPPAGLAVRADRMRLRQVLMNLLSNAIKYNRLGGHAELQARADGCHVVISVTDSGLGLAPGQLAHLWEPFNRLGAERTGIEGTGIGLALTRRMVHLMDGRIEVTSELGRGSRFTVSLPAAPPPGADAAAQPTPAERERTVLYAEDNPLNVELIRQVLQLRPRIRLVVARNGQEALLLARSENPDLLLLDMHLGDMTGIDVLTRLRADGTAPLPACVALSADVMPDSLQRALAAGFDEYLTKPLDMSALMRCLDLRLPA